VPQRDVTHILLDDGLTVSDLAAMNYMGHRSLWMLTFFYRIVKRKDARKAGALPSPSRGDSWCLTKKQDPDYASRCDGKYSSERNVELRFKDLDGKYGINSQAA
jgi:hypothetical protein